jgi:hypothetical protein
VCQISFLGRCFLSDNPNRALRKKLQKRTQLALVSEPRALISVARFRFHRSVGLMASSQQRWAAFRRPTGERLLRSAICFGGTPGACRHRLPSPRHPPKTVTQSLLKHCNLRNGCLNAQLRFSCFSCQTSTVSIVPLLSLYSFFFAG